ncbi:hypothetical protein EC991_008552 [Linnemannia zychae]|nr:hypothetical protein EC991_008552 [Linnemannia zychae]
MTQQVDPRSPAVHDHSSGFEFQTRGSGTSGHTSSSNNTSNNNEGNTGTLEDRWPSLLNARQVLVAFVLEVVSRARPLQEKLNIVISRAWLIYLAYARAYPLLTAFLSTLTILSAIPFIVFASITGVSLGLLIGTAAVIVIIIQSIVATIAGAILLFVLGVIVVLTVFTFFWLVVGYFAFQFTSQVYASFKDQRLRKLREERERERQEKENEDVHEWERPDETQKEK